MDKQVIFRYTGTEIDVEWDERLCIHIGECGYSEGKLFLTGRDPWCQPDLASSSETQDVIQRCPSGALVCKDKQNQCIETAPDKNTLTVSYNGPYFVSGELTIDGAAADMPGVKFRAALCRCGLSKNKPFCDNSHEGHFKDYGAVGKSGEILEQKGGPLKVNGLKDGPLIFSGNLCIRASSGRDAWQGNEAALCRCGASKNKPFCDGSHSKIGFSSDD